MFDVDWGLLVYLGGYPLTYLIYFQISNGTWPIYRWWNMMIHLLNMVMSIARLDSQKVTPIYSDTWNPGISIRQALSPSMHLQISSGCLMFIDVIGFIFWDREPRSDDHGSNGRSPTTSTFMTMTIPQFF